MMYIRKTMGKLRILLADNHKMIREGLQSLINGQPDMRVIGEADNGKAAVAQTQQLQPDVVVMDVSMPDMNGLQATHYLRGLCPGAAILALTRHADDAYVEQLLEAGACGYVLKQSAADILVHAIRVVAAGSTYVDPALIGRLVTKVIDRRPATNAPAKKTLSRREEEVLRLVAWGYLNREIATRLRISVKTAETHKANAMKKLRIKNRVEIVRYGLLQGWLLDT
jgi:two-component system response regulator NreC